LLEFPLVARPRVWGRHNTTPDGRPQSDL